MGSICGAEQETQIPLRGLRNDGRDCTKWSARQPFDSAMHAKMQHCTGFEIMLQPIVEGSILRVGSEVSLKKQAHGVTLYPQCRLYPYPHVPQLHATHQQVACMPIETL